jgi:hypothetical protein
MPPPVTSRAQLQKRYGWVLHVAHLESWNGSMPTTFAHPPVAGNESIEPIRTLEGLFREGAEQHHCIGQYAPEIAQGHGYAYRGRFGSERVTVYLRRFKGSDGPAWGLSECRGVTNESVSEAALTAIGTWLSDEPHTRMESFADVDDTDIPF